MKTKLLLLLLIACMLVAFVGEGRCTWYFTGRLYSGWYSTYCIYSSACYNYYKYYPATRIYYGHGRYGWYCLYYIR